MTVLEILKPPSQDAVNIFKDLSQAVTVAAPGFGPDGIFELLHALGPGPSCAPLKVVAEKVKPFSGKAQVHQSGLFRVQGEAALYGQTAEHLESLSGFLSGAAQNHELIRIADHLKARIGYGNIDGMEVEIGKQRTDHGPLRAPLLGGPQGQVLKNVLLEKGPDQLQHASIGYKAADVCQERFVGNIVEVSLDVGIRT